MKKLSLVLVLALILAGGTLFAQEGEGQGAQFFSFNIGGMISYNMGTQNIAPSNPFGVQFVFDEAFSGGFSFDSGMDTSLLNITVSPADNLKLSFYTGQELTLDVVAFGLGFGYDFLTNNDRFFSAIGIYIDWLATNGGSYDLNSGGVLCIGLKTSFGL